MPEDCHLPPKVARNSSRSSWNFGEASKTPRASEVVSGQTVSISSATAWEASVLIHSFLEIFHTKSLHRLHDDLVGSHGPVVLTTFYYADTDPAATMPASMKMSDSPVFPSLFPMTARNVILVWKAPILRITLLNSLLFPNTLLRFDT